MCKISVLIPSYKPGEYVVSCFESIEKQTLSKSDYKVYVALNGSDLEYMAYLRNVLSRFSFGYHLFFLEEAGVSRARNYLIDNSFGDYVVFVDDDDMISPGYLEGLVHASTSSVMGISNLYNFEKTIGDLKSSYIGLSYSRLPDTTFSKFKARKYFSSPCAKMIHRDIIGATRFDTNIAMGEDSLFMARLSHRVEAVRKAAPGACYYVHERKGSVTRRKVNRAAELKRIFYLLKEYGKMLFGFRYNYLFVLSRIAATMAHGRKLFFNI